jgi:DNA-binding response OmpR family regulator
MTKSETMLVVDTSEPALQEQKKELEKVGILVFRIDSMQEAISRFARGQEYLCVVINEDSNPNFMNLLSVLCDIAKTHIFIITHTYTKEKCAKAMQLGADAYVPFGETARADALCTLQYLKLPEKWAARPLKIVPIFAYGDIVLVLDRQMVFIGNKELVLTKKEFDILHYLMENNGILLTHAQIVDKFWNIDFDKSVQEVLWTHMKRIRQKLKAIAPNREFLIENVYGAGYRFTYNYPITQ